MENFRTKERLHWGQESVVVKSKTILLSFQITIKEF